MFSLWVIHHKMGQYRDKEPNARFRRISNLLSLRNL